MTWCFFSYAYPICRNWLTVWTAGNAVNLQIHETEEQLVTLEWQKAATAAARHAGAERIISVWKWLPPTAPISVGEMAKAVK